MRPCDPSRRWGRTDIPEGADVDGHGIEGGNASLASAAKGACDHPAMPRPSAAIAGLTG